METVVIPLLRRVGNTKKFRVIQLDIVDKVTFGRAVNDVDVCLVSNMISRKHATLTKSADNRWQIQDHGSLNGVYVNDARLAANSPCVLSNKDVVRLGVPPTEGKDAKFVWQYCQAARVCRNANKYKTGNSDLTPGRHSQETQRTLEGASQEFNATDNKRLRSLSNEFEPKPGPSRMSPSGKPPVKRIRQRASPVVSPADAVLRKMEEAEKQAEKIRAEHEVRMAEMAERLRQGEEKQKMQEEEMKKKEEEMKELLANQKKEMEEQFAARQQELQNQYQQDLQLRESKMRRQLEEDHEKLVNERAEIERKLKEDLSSKLGEEKKLMEQELLAEKEKLDKVIQQKECEHKMLREQLDEARNNFNQEKDITALKTKEQIMNNINDILETELQCSICNELFVETMTLNCSHGFCAYCIDQWKQVKRECPVCRAPITSEVRSRAVDSYIEKMCEHLNDEMKAARKQLVEERNAEMKRIREANLQAQQAAASAGRRGRRGGARGRARGAARGRARGGQSQVWTALQTALQGARPPLPGLPQVVVIDDSGQANEIAGVTYADSVVNENVAAVIDVESREDVLSVDDSDEGNDSFIVSDDDDEEWFSDGSSVDGDGAYYGGYGSCFRCGRRGHWANGCPF